MSPNDTVTSLNRARVYLGVGRTADARKEAMTVLEKAPDNGGALIALVDASRTAEEISATEEQLEKLPQKDSAYYHLAAGEIAAKKSDLSDAKTALQRGGAAEPNLTRS